MKCTFYIHFNWGFFRKLPFLCLINMSIWHTIAIILLMISLCVAVEECSTAPLLSPAANTDQRSGRGLDQNNNQCPVLLDHVWISLSWGQTLFSLMFGEWWGREGTPLGAWKLVMGRSKHTQGCVGDGGRVWGVTLSADCWRWREEWSCLGPDAGYDHWGCLRHCSGPLVTSRTAASLRPTHRGLPTPRHTTPHTATLCAAHAGNMLALPSNGNC